MKRKNLINRVLQNVRGPEGFFGRMILWGMNQGHASLTHWGTFRMEWYQGQNMLDIGCGGGANLAQVLKYCSQSKAFGIGISPESVAFARKRNRRQLGIRCSVEQGGVDQLPYSDHGFNVITISETIYFWSDLQHTFIGTTCVLKPGGAFLICCEISDPTNEVWTSRVRGMVVYSEDQLKAILVNAGFINIAVCHHRKEELCIIGHKKMTQL